MGLPAVLIHDKVTRKRLHVITEVSNFKGFRRGDGVNRMTNMQCADHLVEQWARLGRAVVVTEDIDPSPKPGYSVPADFSKMRETP